VHYKPRSEILMQMTAQSRVDEILQTFSGGLLQPSCTSSHG